MFKNIYLKSFTITVIYYLLTGGLSILLYLTIGKYLVEEYPNYINFVETFIYLIVFILISSIFKKKIATFKTKYFEKVYIVKVLLIVLTIAICYRIFIDPLYRIKIIIGNSSYPNLTAQFIPISRKIITFLNFVILIPLIEEFVFRGIILESLLKQKNKFISIIISSFLFALIHINFYPFSFEFISFINAFLIGITAGVIYSKLGLLYCITFHLFFNLLWFILNVIYHNEYWKAIVTLDFSFIYWIIIIVGTSLGLFSLYKLRTFK